MFNPQPKIKPHFEMFMLVSYGLSREQLEDANFRLKGYDHKSWNKDTTKVWLSLCFSLPLTLSLYIVACF